MMIDKRLAAFRLICDSEAKDDLRPIVIVWKYLNSGIRENVMK